MNFFEPKTFWVQHFFWKTLFSLNPKFFWTPPSKKLLLEWYFWTWHIFGLKIFLCTGGGIQTRHYLNCFVIISDNPFRPALTLWMQPRLSVPWRSTLGRWRRFSRCTRSTRSRWPPSCQKGRKCERTLDIWNFVFLHLYLFSKLHKTWVKSHRCSVWKVFRIE